jgi:uncharacterized protein RhaS with RHS repeats
VFTTPAVTSVINRYYDPATGSFINVDPDVAGTGQPYAYAGDDPANAIDPDGLCWSTPSDQQGPCEPAPPGVNYNSSCFSGTGPTAPGAVRCGTLGESNCGSSLGESNTAVGVAAGMTFQAGEESLELTEHAAMRLAQRGISDEDLDAALDQVPFKYFYNGAWQTGYYDSSTGVFAGTVNGQITTVIDNVNPNYIQNLQSAVPDDAAAAGSEVASGEGELGQLGDDFLGFSEDLGGL